jgi:hypothetical protein
MTYATLKADIAGWLHRSDLETTIPTIVQLAESDIRNDVRVRAMETVATGTVSAGQIAQPTDLIELRRLVIDGYPAEYVEPAGFAELDRVDSQRYAYTVVDSTINVLTGSDYSMSYWASFAAFSADGDTNWLLEKAYDVYLWASLKHAAIWAMDDQNTMKFDALYKGSVQRLNAQEAKALRGGTLTVRSSTWA